MLDNLQNARERWGGVSDLIDRWLRDRQQLIVQYCDISGTTDFEDSEQVRNKFGKLCDALVDYVSAGHFEIYEKLIREETTEVALAFNDKLSADAMSEEALRGLMGPLSELGEQLETRFSLEDFLIEHLHNVHADQMVSSA